MAKFSQVFLQSLGNPTYSQGLFDIGKSIAQAPLIGQLERERKETKQGMLEQLQSALSSNDPNVIEKASAEIMKTDPKTGAELARQARNLRLQQRQQNAESGLGYLQNQMTAVLKDESLTSEKKQEELAKYQQSANAIGGAVPGLSPMEISQMSVRTENAVFQQSVARQQEARAQGNFERSVEAFELTKEQHVMAKAKYTEWVNSTDHRVAMQALEQEGAQYQQATRAARAAVGQAGGKEAFNAKYPNMSGVWDAVSTEKEARDLQVAALKTAADAGKFNMSAEEVATMFNSSVESEDVKNFMKLAKSNPKSASTIIANKVSSDLSGPAIPKATVVAMFKDQAMAYATDWDTRVSPGLIQDFDEEEEAAAAEMAVRAAEVYQKTGSYSDAIAVFPLVAAQLSGIKATKDPEQVEPVSELDELRNDLLALEAERQRTLEEEKPLSVN